MSDSATTLPLGAKDASPPSTVVGTLLGRYVLLSRLGEGGGGEVFVAFDPELDRKVAVKRLRGGPGEADALLREARILAKLSHPHVVTVHDVGIDDGRAYLAMELVEGADLGRWLATHRTTASVREILRMLVAAGEGLMAAHAKGIVHGDVKPANVLVGDDGRILVGDFGVARHARLADATGAVDDGSAGMASTAGTPRYMAPEQHAGVPPDPRSDVYAFAVTAWEALLGAPPFSIESARTTTIDGTTAHAEPRLHTPSRSGPHALAELVQAKRAGPPALPADAQGVPTAVLEALRRALQPEPDARIASMAELVAALAPPARKPAGGVWLAGIGALALAGAVALGVGSGDEAIDARCTASAAELVGAWDPERRAEVERAAERLGAAWPAPERVLERLDLYATAWTDMHRSNCEATTIRAQQSERDMELRTRCLLRARAELDATVDLLGRADAEIARRAHDMVTQLPSIERCGDVVAIESAQQRPSDPALATAVEAIREQLAPAYALERAGRYAEVAEIVEPLARQAESLGFLPLVAEIGPVWGHALERVGRGDEAEGVWRRAVEIGIEHGPPGPAARCAGMLVSRLSAQDARFAEAEAWASVGVSLARRTGPGTPTEAFALDHRGGLRLERAQVDAAQRDYEAALAIYERVRQPDHPDIGGTLSSLARVYEARGDLDRAEALHLRAHDVLERAFGPKHPQVAATLSNIGTVLEARGDYEEALRRHLQALDILLPVLGPDHTEIAILYTNIGVCENDLGRLDEAEATQRKALAIIEKAHGPDHVEVGRILVNIGVIELRRLDYAAAEETLARSVRILETELGDSHPHTTATLMNLGIAMASRGRREPALGVFERILAIRERELEPQHPAIASILGNLGHLEMELERWTDAEAHFRRALEIREAKGAEPKDRAFETFGLARALYMQGEKARGLELADEALALWVSAGPGYASQHAEAKAWLDAQPRPRRRAVPAG